jgi:hypothetical protein
VGFFVRASQLRPWQRLASIDIARRRAPPCSTQIRLPAETHRIRAARMLRSLRGRGDFPSWPRRSVYIRPMDSGFACDCGRQISKDVLSGAGLQLLFPVEFIDDDFRNKPAPELLSSILRESRLVLTCGACGRLHVVDEHGRQEPETYVPEP